jgi:adenylate cyclase
MSQSSKHQLAAILFSDIVAYSAMMQQDRAKAIDTVETYQKILELKVAAFRGEVLNDYGDGSLCIFQSATDALRCGIEMQRQFRLEPVVPLRIGIHVGEIIFKNGKPFGDGVNIASRIESLGQAGTIFFSKNVYDKIRNLPEFEITKLGQFKLKNIEEPVRVYALANEGFPVPKASSLTGKLKEKNKIPLSNYKTWLIFALLLFIGWLAYNTYWQKANVDTAYVEKSIAVLPFNNESSNKENQYFCNGIMEGILDHLAKISDLTVISRSSVEQFRNARPSAKKMAEALEVKYLVEGSVQRIGDQAIIFAQLTYAETNRHVWSNKYERNLADIFAIQAEITQSIADELHALIAPELKGRIEAVPTTDPLAYDYFLKGNEYLFEANSFIQSNEKWNDLLNKAKLSYELSLERDTSFAEAIIGLAKEVL